MSNRRWVRNHTRRAHSIYRAFVKSGSRGDTIRGSWGFKKRGSVHVW